MLSQSSMFRENNKKLEVIFKVSFAGTNVLMLAWYCIHTKVVGLNPAQKSLLISFMNPNLS